jgi:hypothetical protein
MDKDCLPTKKARIYFNQGKRVCKILEETYKLPQIDIDTTSFIYKLPNDEKLYIRYRYLTDRYVHNEEFRYNVYYNIHNNNLVMLESNNLKELMTYISKRFFPLLNHPSGNESTLVPINTNKM